MLDKVYSGLHPLASLRGDMDRLLDRMCEGVPGFECRSGFAGNFPAVNLWEDNDGLYAEAELPGVSMSDIDVSVVGNEVSISGGRSTDIGEENSYHRRERRGGKFCRVFRLPIDIDTSKVEASMKNGVLSVKLPKAESAKPVKVKIKALAG